jgi:glycosyltransferase involved in cell wall biosynthesis
LETILATADLVVLPSLWEGLPLVLVEAMSRGVPVVTTNAGGSAELGEANADVIVTGTEWDSFKIGLNEMARRLREGLIDSVRLHQWTESKYGYDVVSAQWIDALLRPGAFFSHAGCGSPRHD